MSEDFRWVDPRVYYSWVGSYWYRSLRDFDGYTLPQRTPATLPFLPAEYQSHPATMNPWLSVWLFKRYLFGQRVVIEPMAGVGGTGVQSPRLIPAIACGLHAGQTFIVNDINPGYAITAHGILSELLRLTNHSSTVFKFEGPAETLHYHIRKAAELGLPRRGGFANAVVFSPPYCNLIATKKLRGFSKDNARTFHGGNYRAFIYQLTASAYIMLRRFGWCVLIVKHATTTLKTPIPEVVVEAMRAVGFKNIEKHIFQPAKPSAYAEYHKARGHEYKHLCNEHVIAGQKLGFSKVVENV